MTSLNFSETQVNHFDKVVKSSGQGALWEMELPKGFSKEEPADYDSQEYLDMLREVKELFRADWMLEMVVNHSWFDDGGPSITLWMVSKEARERVWADIDKTDRVYFPEREYPTDMQLHPEDYRIFVSGPY